MSSSNTKNKNPVEVSRLKAQLRSIINNINALQQLKTEGTSNTISNQVQKNLIEETEALLCTVQNQPQRRLLKSVEKRRLKRVNKSKPKKKFKTITDNCKNQHVEATKSDIGEGTNTDLAPDTKTHEYNEFQQLRNYQQAQRYLRTFELLEILHYSRSQDKDLTQAFRENFNQMRSFWNTVLLDNTPKRTKARRCEDQWNDVLFGANEQTFYGAGNQRSERERMREFLRIRRIWDSYVVRNKQHGSSIPLGWVLPKAEISESWSKYITQ